jgi:subtilisin family serine protease
MLIFGSFKGHSQSQFYLSEVWDMEGGTMPFFYKNASTTDDQRNVYVVGSTNNGSNGNDILIQKFNKLGDLLWEQSFNGGANAEDIGADIFVDASYNVYVTGGATQTTQNNLDLVVLKYNSSGVLQWSYFYNFGGSPIPYDGGTAITGDNNGSIYVTGTSAGTNTMTDFVTIKLNSSNGTQVWTSRYDFAQLNEVPSKIRVSGSSIIVTGASQSTQTPSIKWELATVRYNSSNGNQVGLSRTGGNSSSGIDEANDLTIDNNGNVYVVGTTNNQNTGHDITILKFNDDLQLLWQQTFNGHGLEDKGYGIKTDSQGNVYAVGYVTNPNQGKNHSILKYNSSGTLQWSREFNGLANQDDEAAQLVVRGDRIFVTGAARNGAYSDIVTMGYTADGEIFSVKSFESPYSLNDKPTAMGIDLDDNLIVVGQMQDTTGNFRNVTFKYSVWEKPIVPVYVDSVPAYNQNEVIIRFDKSAMKLTAVNKKDFEAGELHEFVHQYVIDSMNAKFPFDAGKLPTYKIFRRLTTADSLSITRLGDTIKVPAFWATLSVMLPEGYNEFDLIDSLNTLSPIVHYGEVNLFLESCSVPDDPIYLPLQKGLHGASGFDDANINIESAWEIETGSSEIIVGVFDSPIYWAHEDFYVNLAGPQGVFESSKIVDGRDYVSSVPINQIFLPWDSHGTSVAGIIGAVRNNGTGVSGVAGGNFSVQNPLASDAGVQLISFGILSEPPFAGAPGNFYITGLTTSALEAIVEGAVLSTSGEYELGVHIQNHSWTTTSTILEYIANNGQIPNSMALRDATMNAWQNNSIVVASRGNNSSGTSMVPRYPACYFDYAVINVGASGYDGLVKVPDNGDVNVNVPSWSSFHSFDMDFLAPGVTELVSSTHVVTNNPYLWESSLLQSQYPSGYSAFNGTSASAPLVSGVVALMLSKHNVTNGAPNNLATEDVEQILQKTAQRSQNNLGYNGTQGFGLIDAGLALQQVDVENYFVQHFTYVSGAKSVSAPTQKTLTLLSGNAFDVQPGTYVANEYLVTWNFNITLDNNHEIIDFWPLLVKSFPGFLVSMNTISTDELLLFPEVNPTINGNNITFSVQSYAYVLLYEVTNEFTQLNIHLPYHPFGAEKMDYAFSLHIRLNEELSITQNSLNQIKAFPNPTSDIITLECGDISIQNIQIIDASGRVIYQLNEVASDNNRVEITHLQSLSTGLYFIKVLSTEEESFTIKIFKK